MTRLLVSKMKKYINLGIFYHPLFLVFFYLLCHVLVSFFLNDTLQVDDREQIFIGQEFQFGYNIPQPPMYSWISFLFFEMFGANITSLLALKYILIFLNFTFIFKTSEIIFKKNLNAVSISTLSFLLLPSFFWHMHQGFTHTILLGLGIAMSIHYLFRLSLDKSLANYLLFGFSLSVGLLGKYSFIIFIFLILLTVISIKEFRDIFQNKFFFYALVLIFLLISPHYIWLLNNWHNIYPMAAERLIASSGTSFFMILLEFIKASIGFLFPYILFIFFKVNSNYKGTKKIIEKFLENYLYFIIIFGILFLAIFDIKEIKVRWLHPILMIVPFWISIKIVNKNPSRALLKTFYISLFVTSLIILTIRIVQNTYAPKLGYQGRVNTPIIETLKMIPVSVLDKVSLIRTDDYFLGPHLFSVFNEKDIQILNKKFQANLNEDRKCLIIWDDDSYDDNHNLKFSSYTGILTNNRNPKPYNLFYKILDINEC